MTPLQGWLNTRLVIAIDGEVAEWLKAMVC
jgi:hypothetical protein